VRVAFVTCRSQMPVAVALSLRRLTGNSRSHHEPGMTWGAEVSEEIRRTVGSCAMEELDRQIVQLLVKDGRMSYTDLGKATGLSTSAVHQRVRRLEQRGVIRG
jgi:DNA-directed RNA polymerase specialized sigma24 family protein